MIALNKDVCICCQETKNNITKHHVVPHCYVQYLGMNRVQYGNKVNLCHICHEEYEYCATDKKQTYSIAAGFKRQRSRPATKEVGQIVAELRLENEFVIEWQTHFQKWVWKKQRALGFCNS